MSPYTVTVGNSFLWTIKGLKSICDLEAGDVILGVNRTGKYTWQKLNRHPVPKGEGELIHIVTDRSEIAISSECPLCGVGELVNPENINVGTKLGIFHEDTLIPMWLAKQPECAQFVFVDGQEVPVTESVAYLIGAATRRLPWSQDRLIIKVPKPQLKEAKKSLDEKLRRIPQIRDRPELDVESGQLWSWIIIRSEFVIKLVKTLAIQPSIVPSVILRSSRLVCSNFARGYIDMAGIRLSDEDEIKIETELYESELRRFLYNIFTIHFIRCATTAFPSYQPSRIILKTSMSELKQMLKKKLTIKSLEAYTKVRARFKSLEPMYALPIETYEWSPVIDLMMLPI